MEKLKARLRKQGGFTLIEMLIVVAIIAILVAVSIPMISDALERAKMATDAANERAAKAEILIQYLSDNVEAETDYMYNAADGNLVDKNTGTDPTGYGKCEAHEGGYILVEISDKDNPVVDISWVCKDGKTSTDLCSNEINKE